MAIRTDQVAIDIAGKSTAAPQLRTTKISLSVLSDPPPAAETAVCPCDSYGHRHEEDLQHQTHRLARCWELMRTDGTTYRFTDHNRKLVVAKKDGTGNNTFTPIQGMSATAQQRRAGVEVGNYEALGAVGTVSFNSLLGGYFRDAKLTELVVDWRYPFLGAFRCQTHFVKRLSFDGEKWEAQMVGQRGRLERPIGAIYTRNCRFKLYDNFSCTVDENLFDETGLTVSAVDANEPYRKFTATATGGATFNGSTWYRFGNVTWTGGNNNGLSMEIRNWVGSPTHSWELYIEMPNKIVVNDTFTAFAGCDKTLVQCNDKFTNRVNFGGFPFMPGPDALIRGPGVSPEQALFGIISAIFNLVF